MYRGASWGHYVNQAVKKTRKHKTVCVLWDLGSRLILVYDPNL